MAPRKTILLLTAALLAAMALNASNAAPVSIRQSSTSVSKRQTVFLTKSQIRSLSK
ncbi:hypothetical protein BGZ89_005459, partial [Linnemannia elongata]